VVHQPIELAKDKHSVECDIAQGLIRALEQIKSALEVGELDTQTEVASGVLRKRFKR
jgi:hypothetical protein